MINVLVIMNTCVSINLNLIGLKSWVLLPSPANILLCSFEYMCSLLLTIMFFTSIPSSSPLFLLPVPFPFSALFSHPADDVFLWFAPFPTNTTPQTPRSAPLPNPIQHVTLFRSHHHPNENCKWWNALPYHVCCKSRVLLYLRASVSLLVPACVCCDKW